jgi:phosphosulfolactate phosphohydrolase-like enzyme
VYLGLLVWFAMEQKDVLLACIDTDSPSSVEDVLVSEKLMARISYMAIGKKE